MLIGESHGGIQAGKFRSAELDTGIVGVVETTKDKKGPDRKILFFGKPEVTADFGLGV